MNKGKSLFFLIGEARVGYIKAVYRGSKSNNRHMGGINGAVMAIFALEDN